ncbi:MAG: dTDP-4-dehydrorhamnose 3,5-epimerase [Abyssibacter sp.]|uniref:dTDP-4-dehydrorhamnose 3,5-epimerase n=1 Tax=Abyssibacter sp. TaxID=2320200 RepID=UPI002EAC7482|nr:dTDP-4-dehydrorhamnose 3,5-epimerase [Pseudomonadota bacterium]
MRFFSTAIHGAMRIALEPHADERGQFARSFCSKEFAAAGLPTQFCQSNLSQSVQAGTLRGMHYQLAPHAEGKLIRCTTGSLLDVIVDVRPDSPSFRQHVTATLSAENQVALYLPPGVAHGFLTLLPHTEAHYWVTAAYAPDAERGFRYDDPWLGITWPQVPRVLSDKDAAWPAYDPDFHRLDRLSGLAGAPNT